MFRVLIVHAYKIEDQAKKETDDNHPKISLKRKYNVDEQQGLT